MGGESKFLIRAAAWVLPNTDRMGYMPMCGFSVDFFSAI